MNRTRIDLDSDLALYCVEKNGVYGAVFGLAIGTDSGSIEYYVPQTRQTGQFTATFRRVYDWRSMSLVRRPVP